MGPPVDRSSGSLVKNGKYSGLIVHVGGFIYFKCTVPGIFCVLKGELCAKVVPEITCDINL